VARADLDQLHAVPRQFLAQAFAIAHGVPVGLSSVIVQSQALFTIGFAALLFREIAGACRRVASASPRRPADDLRHRRLRFQRRRVRHLMISPLSFASATLAPARAGVPMFDCSRGCAWSRGPVAGADAGQQRPQPTWHALTNADA
jgi:O-acetylserine/cysteine efflux transporter